MSVQKRGLGRGLDALLGQPRPTPGGFLALPLDAITPSTQQPRQTFDQAALAELEQSIRELGVLVPIIVRPLGGPGPAPKYELIAGERRWRAAAAARLETIPAIVREADDRTSLELAVVENLQREDLDPLEEAMGFQQLLAEYDFTQERLAERIGKSRPVIANALRLLGLSDVLKAKLRGGSISVGHARALLALDESERERVAASIERDGLSVRDIERLGEGRRSKRAAKATQMKSPDVEAVESRLRYRLGAPVALVAAARGGKIEIKYADDADLMRLIDALLPASE
ncbi:MAG: ParB/RepB/Spo0J family partition protein [Candidatus Eremiobacteraeota bacterium]|nr:ParB/RepB/Spo0J family partition protein [Candidatus Eremiobacteraeota bacterium]